MQQKRRYLIYGRRHVSGITSSGTLKSQKIGKPEQEKVLTLNPLEKMFLKLITLELLNHLKRNLDDLL